MITLKKPTSLRAQVTERLFDAILTGELKPGERIFEGKLARQMKVSQTTVREALQVLENRGLIVKYDNRATFVTKLSAKQAEDRFAVRLELEPLAAAEACRHLSSEDHAQLAMYIAGMETAWREGKYVELVLNDLAFHRHIWKLSRNPVLESTLGQVCAPLFAFHYMALAHYQGSSALPDYDFAEDHKEHRDLLNVIASAKPDEARKAFQEMIHAWQSRALRDVRKEQGEETGSIRTVEK